MRSGKIASRPHRDAAVRIELQFKLGAARGAEPEELRVCVWLFVSIQVAGVQQLELCTAGWIDAATDH